MKYLIFFFYLVSTAGYSSLLMAQENNPRETAKAFLRQGDYNNAILILNRAIEKDNNSLELKKDLAFTYYLQRDYVKALEISKPFAERKDADVQSFQILGMTYKAIENRKEAEKMYRAALKKFPESGVLYNEYGEMLWSKNDFTESVKLWEKGIQSEPSYPGNYYNIAKYYYFSADKVWGLLYGEIFINLESYSKRTPEIKDMLLNGYKKLFTETDIFKNQDSKNEFSKAFLTYMKQYSQGMTGGVTPEALSALRTKFILDWYEKENTRFPFRLFDYHRQLAKAGMFDAYNEWIFGAANDLTAFQQWIATHSEEYEKFNSFQKNRVFKMPQGQYYR